MSFPLLTTKLYFPSASHPLVLRPRLEAALSRAPECALTLVSAPPGYGKTTFVSRWLRESGQAVTWLSLDEGDNDPIRFVAYLIAALQKLDPTIGTEVLEAVQSMQPPPPQILLGALINEIAGKLAPFFLVLDDFHAIHAQAVLQIFTFLLDHLPAQMHLVLISRVDPFLPLSRLRVRNQLIEIRADLLRFTREETATFLNDTMRLGLSAEDVTVFEMHTEGWIAGLQLAAIALQTYLAAHPGFSKQRQEDIHCFLSAFTGSSGTSFPGTRFHRHILDFLVEEVLNRQSDEVCAFLLQTSILERFNGELCEAVVSEEEVTSGQWSVVSEDVVPDHALPTDHRPPATDHFTGHSQLLLEHLERANLFLIPLDDERQWYRYHHLFAEVLGNRLRQTYPDRLPILHRRAAKWYASHGFVAEAIRHALAAGDQGYAAQLVEKNALSMLLHGEMVTLLNWLAAIESQLPERPWLRVYQSWALTLTGQLDRIEPLLQEAERARFAERGPLASPPESGTEGIFGHTTAIRAYAAVLRGDVVHATGLARQALRLLSESLLPEGVLPQGLPPEGGLILRGIITGVLGRACWMSGDLDEASRAFSEAERTGQASGNMHLASGAACSQADLFFEQGKFQQACETYRRALQLAKRPDGRYMPAAGRAYAGLSRVFYEWNDLETAMQYLQPCMVLCQQWGNAEPLSVGYVMQARIRQAQGDPGGAWEVMQEALCVAHDHHLISIWSNWVDAFLVRFWLLRGDFEASTGWAQENGLGIDDDIPYVREVLYLAFVRILLAQGQADSALALTRHLLSQFETAGEIRRAVETLVLQALVYQSNGELLQASLAVEKALAITQAEGYLRVYLDEGEQMHSLLMHYRSQVERGRSIPDPQLAGCVSGISFHGTEFRGTSFYGTECRAHLARLLAEFESEEKLKVKTAQMTARSSLTEREIEVLQGIAAGLSNQEIAGELVIEVSTVKRHISNIYNKLGVQSRTQALAKAREIHLLK